MPTDNQNTIPDDFDPVWYLQTYPDVRESGMDPQEHYVLMGRAEGRLRAPVVALELDHMLWRGFEDEALPALRDLLHAGSAEEQGVAGWALARWELEQGNSLAALESIRVFHQHAEQARVIGHLGPYLLAVQLALSCGHADEAARYLDAGRARFGPSPDFGFAQLMCDSSAGASEEMLVDQLARVFTSRGLAPVTLAAGAGSRFDRLVSADLPAPALGDTPLVSVIVPVFNGETGLGHALSGLQAQSWKALEIIVVDDGSTDNSLQIARDKAAEDPRIRVIELGQNQGAYPARNAGFAAATGAFITVHDADDWSHPFKVEAQARELVLDPELKATVSHWVRADDDLNMTRWRMEEGWVYRNVSSLMLRAEIRDTLGYWDRVKVNADTEYYYRLIAACGPHAIREVWPGVPLSFGRTAPHSLTQKKDTHLRTQFVGLRRDYMDAARHWHSLALQGRDLFLPEFPGVRPFRVPEGIGLGDPEGPQSDYDLLKASDHFRTRWYQQGNRGVLLADICPVHHYLTGGFHEDHDPAPDFSSGGYRFAQELPPDVVPLVHWERQGKAAGANPLPVFEGALARDADGMRRILVFAHTSGKTLFGAERSLLGVLERMVQRGDCPVVVLPALRNPGYLKRLLPLTASVEVLPLIWRHAHVTPHTDTIRRARALIRKHDPAEIHVNTLVLDAPLLAAREEGRESIVHVRELPAEDTALCRILGQSHEVLRQELLAQADRFVATSEPVAQWLGCPERTVIRPNSVDERLFDLPFEPGETLRVALVSSNIMKKGLADFLDVARIVEQANRNIRFLLIGPPSHDLHLLRPWPANVDFRGYAPGPNAAMLQADVVLSLSKFAESFGRTVMEAMASGRPVICYDRGTPPYLVQSGESGFVVPADSPQGVANAILALDAARIRLSAMSRAARKRARALQEQAMRG